MWSPLWETGTECRIIKCLLKHLNGCSIEGRLTIVLPAQLGLGLKVKFAIMDKWVLESGDHQETILIQISPQCFRIMLKLCPMPWSSNIQSVSVLSLMAAGPGTDLWYCIWLFIKCSLPRYPLSAIGTNSDIQHIEQIL